MKPARAETSCTGASPWPGVDAAAGAAAAAAEPARRGDLGDHDAPRFTTLVCVGIACLDLLMVAPFPTPDSKVRARAYSRLGGGNGSTALVAARRVVDGDALAMHLVTALGSDSEGADIVRELEHERIHVHALLVAGNSPVSFVIVDPASATRTIVHMPGSEPTACDLTRFAVPPVLARAHGPPLWLHFDGRFHELVNAVLAAPGAAGATISAEVERSAHFAVLALAHIVAVSEAIFAEMASGGSPTAAERAPKSAAFDATDEHGAACAAQVSQQTPSRDAATRVVDGLCELVALAPHAVLVSVTRGARGAFVLRLGADARASPSALRALVERAVVALGELESEPVPVGMVAGRGSRPLGGGATVWYSGGYPLAAGTVVDTTGAGDSFTGALIAMLARGATVADALEIATFVGARCCTAMGGRPGLPRAAELPDALQRIVARACA